MNGTFVYDGQHNDRQSWRNEDSTYFIWSFTEPDTWIISTVKGGGMEEIENYWTLEAWHNEGTYTAGGAATGEAIVERV